MWGAQAHGLQLLERLQDGATTRPVAEPIYSFSQKEIQREDSRDSESSRGPETETRHNSETQGNRPKGEAPPRKPRDRETQSPKRL